MKNVKIIIVYRVFISSSFVGPLLPGKGKYETVIAYHTVCAPISSHYVHRKGLRCTVNVPMVVLLVSKAYIRKATCSTVPGTGTRI